MKYRIRRRILAAAVLLLCACLFFGCHKDGGKPGTQNGGQKNAAAGTDASPDLVFRGVQINPEGPIVDPLIRPYVDPDGNFIIAALESRQEDGTYGTVRLERDPDAGWILCTDTFRSFGDVIPIRGVLTEDGAVFVTMDGQQSLSVSVLDADYTCTASVPIAKIMPGGSNPVALSVGPDGIVWLAGHNWLAALEPDLSVRFADTVDTEIQSIAADEEGGAWVLCGNNVRCLDAGGACVSTLHIDELIDAQMGAVYSHDGVLYASVSRGLIAYREGEWSLAVDYAAADITRTFTFPFAFLDDGEMILSLFNGRDRQILWDYRYVPKPEEDDGPIRLEIVTEYGLGPPGFAAIVADFNRSQDRIRVTVTKMSDLYGNDPDHAQEAFGRDLVTGVRRPDMVYEVSDRILNAVAKHSLYVDLSSFLSSDADVNFDNLFGGARKTVTYRTC